MKSDKQRTGTAGKSREKQINQLQIDLTHYENHAAAAKKMKNSQKPESPSAN
ncbi:hypothetical protein [Paenibacillus thalictri]|uniref:hypothetical protein n=1 Tax=Paenibacillus thalictri TaxID=2527873 RepID=UPI0013EF299A|nr:hypothetical protein [Paenibacillus thalictri]